MVSAFDPHWRVGAQAQRLNNGHAADQTTGSDYVDKFPL
jgi:hypothetical protein